MSDESKKDTGTMGNSESIVQRLVMCHSKKDKLITELWSVLNEIYDIEGYDTFRNDDLDLWNEVTGHSAMQKRIDTMDFMSPADEETQCIFCRVRDKTL